MTSENFSLIEERIGKNNRVLPEMSDSVCMEKLDKHHMISLDPLDINNAIKRKHLLPLLMVLPEGWQMPDSSVFIRSKQQVWQLELAQPSLAYL